MENNSNQTHEWCPPGESGPRRSTLQQQQRDIEPMEIAAANAEATRLAQELGVSSSTGSHNARLINSSSRRAKRRSLNLFTRNNNKNNSVSSLHQQSTSAAAYQAVQPDGTVAGVGHYNPNNNVTSTITNIVDTASQVSSYKNSIYYDEDTMNDNDDAHTISTTDEPGLFDSSGMRAPYRKGPYDFHHDDYGRLIKKRWCT
jgi:hypothetical protein